MRKQSCATPRAERTQPILRKTLKITGHVDALGADVLLLAEVAAREKSQPQQTAFATKNERLNATGQNLGGNSRPQGDNDPGRCPCETEGATGSVDARSVRRGRG